MSKRKLSLLLLPVILWFMIMGIIRERESNELPHPWQEGMYLTIEGTIYQTGHTKTATTVYLKNISIHSKSDESLSEQSYEEIYKKTNVIVYLKEDAPFFIGDRILVTGAVSYPSLPANPGGFNSASFYAAKNIYLFLRKGIIKDRVIHKSRIKELFRRLQERIKEVIDTSAPETEAQILKSLLLGDRSDMDDEIKSLYQDNGIIHVLAISGLHISMIGMTLFHFLRKCRVSYAGSACVSLCIILCYGFLTGFPVSAIRAVFMFALYLGAQVTGRTVDMITSMCLAAVWMLFYNPYLVTQSGFLLSFGAVAGVLTSNLFPIPYRKLNAFTVSVSTWLVTLPITAYFFYQVPLGGIILNLFVVPSMSVIVAFGILGTLTGFLFPSIAGFILSPVHYLLNITLILCEKVRLLPGMLLNTGKPSEIRMVLFYLILYISLCMFRKRDSIRMKGLRVAGILLAVLIILIPIHTDWSVTFINVGQGDGICIKTDENHVYMVDGGSSSEYNVGTYILEPYLKSTRSATVQAWFVSHYDADHVNGLIQILEGYKRNLTGRNISGVTIKRIILPGLQSEQEEKEELKKEIIQLAKQNQIPVFYVTKGESFQDKNTIFEVIGPRKETLYEDSNAGSMILKVSYEDFSILLTGDVQGKGEEELIENNLGEIDVLKVAHHGSKNSSSLEVLTYIQPKMAVISCGENNKYGHPHKEVLEHLEDLHIQIRRTDLYGPVKFVVKKKKSGMAIITSIRNLRSALTAVYKEMIQNTYSG